MNKGGNDLDISIPVSSTGAFFEWRALQVTIPPNQNRFLDVEFRPRGEGRVAAIMQVMSNDPQGPHSFNLNGTGFIGEPS